MGHCAVPAFGSSHLSLKGYSYVSLTCCLSGRQSLYLRLTLDWPHIVVAVVIAELVFIASLLSESKYGLEIGDEVMLPHSISATRCQRGGYRRREVDAGTCIYFPYRPTQKCTFGRYNPKEAKPPRRLRCVSARPHGASRSRGLPSRTSNRPAAGQTCAHAYIAGAVIYDIEVVVWQTTALSLWACNGGIEEGWQEGQQRQVGPRRSWWCHEAQIISSLQTYLSPSPHQSLTCI